MNNIRFMEIAPDQKHELRMDAQSHFGTFEVKDDATLYKKVNKLAHSTFDKSKFTIVGSPTITDDGIASGFGSGNYPKADVSITPVNRLVFKSRIIYNTSGNTSPYPQAKVFYGTNNNWKLQTNYGDNIQFSSTDLGNIYLNIGTMADGDIIDTELIITTTSVTINAIHNGVNFTKTESKNVTFGLISDLVFGNMFNGGKFFFTGSIDLKQFSITVDGKEVFNGNKEGLDVIKPDEFTVVGSPTITEDGIASGFSRSNYIDTEYTTPSTCYSYKESIEFTTGNDVATPQVIIGSAENTNYMASYRTFNISLDNGKWLIRITTNGTEWNIAYFDGTITANTKYKLDFEWNGSVYSISVTPDGGTTTVIYTVNNANFVIPNRHFIGNSIWQGLNRPFLGSIDLNAFRIYVDGQLVYQPCLKIPYTEGQNYVKVVDKLYRDRVKDLFEQKGYNGYYTIGEDDFTLPSNKWSDVIEHKENGLTVAEQRVDQTLTIRGTCEQGVDVNLPMEFFSNDSYAVFGVGTTGTNTASKFTPAADGNYIAIGKGKV